MFPGIRSHLTLTIILTAAQVQEYTILSLPMPKHRVKYHSHGFHVVCDLIEINMKYTYKFIFTYFLYYMPNCHEDCDN